MKRIVVNYFKMTTLKSCHIFIFISTFLLFVQYCKSDSALAYAKLSCTKEDGSSKDYSYSKYIKEFTDILSFKLIKKLTSVDRICVVGAWLAYERENFVVDVLEKVVLIGGTESSPQCVDHGQLGFDLGSIQPLVPIFKWNASTIAFLPNELFDGEAMVNANANKSPSKQPRAGMPVGSFVISQSKSWHIVLPNKKEMCLVPDQSKTSPVCLVSNFVDNRLVFPGGILAVRRGCKSSNNDTQIVELTECYEMDSGLHPINAAYTTPPPTNDTEDPRCKKDENPLDEELIELIKDRLSGHLLSGDLLKAIKNPKNIWKMELFDRVYNIFINLCPPEIVDTMFTQMYATLYMYHLEKVWESGQFLNTSIREQDYIEMIYDIGRCAGNLNQAPTHPTATIDAINHYENLDDIKKMVEESVGLRPDFDYVMELNYMMSNLVASVCYNVIGFDVNFWTSFWSIYPELYFMPVMEQWANPNKFAAVYKYLFGGYGLEKMMVKVGLCAVDGMIDTAVAEPFIRPMEQEVKALLPKPVEANGGGVEWDPNEKETNYVKVAPTPKQKETKDQKVEPKESETKDPEPKEAETSDPEPKEPETNDQEERK